MMKLYLLNHFDLPVGIGQQKAGSPTEQCSTALDNSQNTLGTCSSFLILFTINPPTNLQDFSQGTAQNCPICDAVIAEVQFSQAGVLSQTHDEILDICGTYIFCPVAKME